MLNKNKAIFTFGDFRLDVGEARLTHRGRVIPLAPKAFSMLVLLVEHAGELIEKEDILRVLWPDSFVEEANLTVHVSALRKALATEDNAQFIETVPKRGYRFSAPVSIIEPVPALETPPDSPAISEQPHRRRRRHPWFAVAGVLVFAAVVGWWGMKTVESKTPPAIAVLPFQTLSPSTDQDHCLGIGMADALINRLATRREFNVRTTGQVREFDKSGVDAMAAARELKAEWVLTGSLQHLDRSLRVTVQLIRGGTGKTIWAEKYDEPFTNIFSVEDEISEKLARTLAPRLSSGAQQILMRRSTANPEAFRLYAEGRVETERLVSGSDARARDLFERAIQLDPTYPQPYIGLVDVLMENWYQEPEHRAQYETRIRECVATVRKLDPEWPELYMASGWVAEILQRDWPRAEAEFKQALAINPNLAAAHASYGWMLNTLGRLTESEWELRRAFELNPVGDLAGLKLAWVIYEQRRFRDALNLAQSVRAENASQLYSSAIGQLVALSLVHLGRSEEAARETDRLAQLSEAPPSILAELYALTGRRQQALAMIERSKLKVRGQANPLAVAELALGNKEEALRILESAVERRDGVVLMSGNDIDLELLWGDTRFKALLTRMGLPHVQTAGRQPPQ